MGAAAVRSPPPDVFERRQRWLKRRSRPSSRSCSTRRRSRLRASSPRTRSSPTPRSTSEAERGPGGLLGRAGRGARLGREVGPGARLVQPAVRQVVRGRQAQRLLQLRRPPRRGRQRRPRGLPLARRGGRGARRHVRRPAPRRPALRQRAEGPRDRAGRRGRDLPADDPRGRRGDARLRADRRAAQRRLRRLLAGVGQGADGVLRGEGADHRRRRAPQGQDGADQAAGRRGDGRPRPPRDDHRRPAHQRRLLDAGGPRLLVAHRGGGRRRRVPGRAAGRRAPALHPLHERLDGQAEGHPAHHRRLPHAGRLDPQARLRPQARRGRLLVLGRRRLGHRALLHRLRAAGQRLHVGDVRGRARLPGQGHLVGAVSSATR